MDGVSDLWKMKGGSQQKYPSYPEPCCSCRAKKDAGPPIWSRRKRKKKKNKEKKNPNLPTYRPHIKAAKLLWKQAASSTALYQISRKQVLDNSQGLGLFPNTRSLQGTPNLNHQMYWNSTGCRLPQDSEPSLSNRHNS